MAALLIKTNGTMETVQPKNGALFSMLEIISKVSILRIKIFDLGNKCGLYVNPDADQLGLAYNSAATTLLHEQFNFAGVVYGDALIVQLEEIDHYVKRIAKEAHAEA